MCSDLYDVYATGAHRHGTRRSNVMKERPWSEEARSYVTNSAPPTGDAGVLLLVHRQKPKISCIIDDIVRPAGCPCDPETEKDGTVGCPGDRIQKRHQWPAKGKKIEVSGQNLTPISRPEPHHTCMCDSAVWVPPDHLGSPGKSHSGVYRVSVDGRR